MSVSFRPAVRENVRLLIGVAGGTGSGKTFSALRLATGLAGGKPFALIDTENGRALEYADLFDFHHGDLRAPFTPAAYQAAIRDADQAGYPVIVVDSGSHEHAGDGGLIDWHEAEVTRMAGKDADWKRREAVTFAAWVKPKEAHKRFVNGLLQTRAHLIICLRAEEKIEIVRNAQGKTEVQPKRSPGRGIDGWMPVAEKNLPYELTISLLLTNEQPGVPKPIKLGVTYQPLVSLTEQLSEETGKRLAAYAAGADKSSGARPVADEGVTGTGRNASSEPVPAAPEQPVLDPAQREDPAGEPSEPTHEAPIASSAAADAHPTGQAASPAVTLEQANAMVVPDTDLTGQKIQRGGKPLADVPTSFLTWVRDETSADRWPTELLAAISVVLDERAQVPA